jgi:hypothetical protein
MTSRLQAGKLLSHAAAQVPPSVQVSVEQESASLQSRSELQAAAIQLPLQQIPLSPSQSASALQAAGTGACHSFTAPSLPPEAIFEPSGENATSFTRLVCAFSS